MSTAVETAERFWSKVDVTEDCWLWRAVTDVEGYGRFRIRGGMERAHRVAYTFVVGPIPDGLVLDHLCRVKSCVNPFHLEPVSRWENVRRSDNLFAAQSRRTHCKRGHEFTEANTNLRPPNRRECRACKYARTARRRLAARVLGVSS